MTIESVPHPYLDMFYNGNRQLKMSYAPGDGDSLLVLFTTNSITFLNMIVTCNTLWSAEHVHNIDIIDITPGQYSKE